MICEICTHNCKVKMIDLVFEIVGLYAQFLAWEKFLETALVLEKIPAHLAEKVAQSISIPVIGIGAGGGVDGQVLVIHDMLGMNNEFSPRFLRRYLNLYEQMTKAIGNYVTDVKSQDFPNASEQY